MSGGSKKKIFSNSVWMIIQQLYSMITSFVLVALIARHLGPSDYGLISYCASVITIFTTLSGLGLDNVIVSEIIKNPEKEGGYLGTALVMRLAASLVSYPMILILISLINPGNKILLTVAALLLLYLWDNLISFIPNTASASYIVLIIATALLCVASHSFTRNVLITIIIGAVGIGASTAAYLILGERMANLASKALGSFSMMKPLDNFAIYSIFDLRGIVLYLSLTALFLFLTMQTVQKRRWS